MESYNKALEDLALLEDIKKKEIILNEVLSDVYNPQELYKLIQSVNLHSKTLNVDTTNAISIVGTGGDVIKTMNYSTITVLALAYLGIESVKPINDIFNKNCSSCLCLKELNCFFSKSIEDFQFSLQKYKYVFFRLSDFNNLLTKIISNNIETPIYEKVEKLFRIIIPLLNISNCQKMLVGVNNDNLLLPYAEVLSLKGITDAYIVYGDGIDEFSITGPNKIAKLKDMEITEFILHPEQLDLSRVDKSFLVDDSVDIYEKIENINKMFSGEIASAKVEMLILNIAAALHIVNGFKGEISDFILELKPNFIKGNFSKMLM